MHSASFAAELGIKELEQVERQIMDALGESSGPIRDMCNHVLYSGGKRVRPLLLLYSGLAFSGDREKLISAAAAAELIHMASLVHDDIIDRSDLRRGRPSVVKLWGSLYSVLCGDYLFAKAFGILSSLRLLQCLNYMVEAISGMCTGEIIQAASRSAHIAQIDTYYEQITKKTAKFLECCCKAGACTAGASEEQVAAMGEYGLNLGLAFQIADDVLDFKGSSEIMGKPRNEDLRQGIVTLPVLLLLNDKSLGEQARTILGKRRCSEQDILAINRLLNKSGALEAALEIAANHVAKAKKSLSSVPLCEYTLNLLDYADTLMTRNY